MALRKLKDEFVLPTGAPIPQSLAGILPTTTQQANKTMAVVAPPAARLPVNTNMQEAAAPKVIPGPAPAPKVAAPPPTPPTPVDALIPRSPMSLDMGDTGNQIDWQAWLEAMGQAGDMSDAIKYLQGLDLSSPASILDALMAKVGPAPKAPRIDINAEANRKLRQLLDPQYTAIDQAEADLLKLFNESTAREQSYGQQGKADLQQIYGALANSLMGSNTRTAGYYDTQNTETNQAYNQAAQAMQAVNDKVTNSLRSRASAQGVGADALANPNSPLAGILSSYQDMANANTAGQANAISNIAANKTTAQQLGEANVQNAQSAGALAQSDLANQVANVLSQLNSEYSTNRTGYERQREALKASEGGQLQDFINSLTDAQYQNDRQTWKDYLDEISTLGNLDLKGQSNQLQAQGNQLQRGTALAGIIGDQAKNKLSALQKVYDSQVTTPVQRAQIAEIQDKINSRPPTPQEQNLSLDQYLNSTQNGLWDAAGGGAGKFFRQGVNDLIRTAGQPISSGTSLHDLPSNTDLFAIAQQNAINQYGDPSNLAPGLHQLNLQGLLNALRKYYFPGGY